ncbi:MAG: hypothetical protein OXH57_01275, partial [Ekhidna sp.]|nr:hypothetical protein [Ekhidna sp.]
EQSKKNLNVGSDNNFRQTNMKNMILILSMLFFVIGCNEEKVNEQQENSIYGTWQLKEQWLGNVGDVSVNWTSVSNGYTMSLMKNNSFSSTEFTVCQNSVNNGNLTLSQNESINLIEISFQCDSRSNQLTRTYVYSFENKYLVLSPYSNPCDEGCSFKYKKTADSPVRK